MPNPAFDPSEQPDWTDDGSIDAAVDGLRAAHDEASAGEAHDTFLWAVGNGHTGTFFPVVLAVLPELEVILRGGSMWAQRAVLESLIDLGGSFVPEAGQEAHGGKPVQPALHAFIVTLRETVVPLTAHDDLRGASARELAELIDDLTPPQ